MIKKDINPGEWSDFMYELEDAKEHLAKLIADLNDDPDYDETNLRIDLGHVFSHLNRAWHRRGMTKDFSDEEWKLASNFPGDLEPI
ncbi:MAG: hypothetical protein JWP96_1617 [Polaromonas sp.]|nr:hypothetical protein [Polaromonas sp.]